MAELIDAEAALFAISPDIGYEEWMRVGMAAQAAGISLETFDHWSAGGQSYEKAAVKALWKSYKPDKGISAGTLFHIAKSHGYRPQHTPQAFVPDFDFDAFIRNTKARQEAQSKATFSEAQTIWDRSEPAPDDHPYIVRKQGSAEGLRRVPAGDPLKILGESMAGALILPVKRTDGSLSSLQFVTTGDVESRLKTNGKATKLNLPGASLEGWHMVGTALPGQPLYVCEGIGQAWACSRVTGHAAVVAFGWGRVEPLTPQLHRTFPSCTLVLVPDKGKEAKAMEIAREHACLLVTMPSIWPDNSDVNDLAHTEGDKALQALLHQAKRQPSPDKVSEHPLARFVDFDCQPRAPRWVIPGFIGQGVVIVAGAHGVGKTTAMLPMSMVAAGLHHADDPLAPPHWRHVIYIVEDVEQAQRILAGMVDHGDMQLDKAAFTERLHLVEACRLPPDEVAAVGKTYRDQFTRHVDGVALLPLVVIDTKAAVIAMESENDNAEGSAAMAHLKQGFEGLPTWIIGHVSKQNVNRADVDSISLRGGSSFEADANQVLYLIKESDGTRYLIRGKTRFEAKWADLKIESHQAEALAPDEFGTMEKVLMRWGTPCPSELPRLQAVAQAKEGSRQADWDNLTRQVLESIHQAWAAGAPLNREGAKILMGRNRNKVTEILTNLVADRWLIEVQVPVDQRAHFARKSFLVALTEHERNNLITDGVFPDDKMVIPASWRKPDGPSPALNVPSANEVPN